MQRNPIQQFSVLGLILMAASAVTAAVLPAKTITIQTNSADNGRVLVNSGVGGAQNPPVYSCIAAAGTPDCHLSISGTGVETFVMDEYGNLYDTLNNTSLSDPAIAGDTTSILVMVN